MSPESGLRGRAQTPVTLCPPASRARVLPWRKSRWSCKNGPGIKSRSGSRCSETRGYLAPSSALWETLKREFVVRSWDLRSDDAQSDIVLAPVILSQSFIASSRRRSVNRLFIVRSRYTSTLCLFAKQYWYAKVLRITSTIVSFSLARGRPAAPFRRSCARKWIEKCRISLLYDRRNHHDVRTR